MTQNKQQTDQPELISDATAMDWLAKHNSSFNLFINGEFVDSSGNETFAVNSPADGRHLGTVTQGTEDDVNAAVSAAREAHEQWSELSGYERAQILQKLATLLQDNAHEFAVLESLDNGKPYSETSNADLPLAIAHFDQHADYAALLDNSSEFSDFESHGVVGQVIPWNFPLLMLAWKVAPALATGNTIVLKPAEQTPFTALKFAELCQEAGLPAGVLNIVTGDGRTGAAVVNHPDIDKVAFTGSTEVGKKIRAATAGTGKGLTLELGGKSPFIVFNDADIEAAIEGVVTSIWFNQGEVCCGGSRLLVEDDIYDTFIEKLKDRMKSLHVGHPLSTDVTMGSLVSEEQHERVSGFVDRARDIGAQIHQIEKAEGCYYPPTLVTDVSTDTEIVRDEIFGPVVTAIKFDDFDTAIEIANDTSYGLASAVWTKDNAKLNKASLAIKSGVVWQNGANQFDATVGFGGYRESGFGREGGTEGLFAYLRNTKEKTGLNVKPADHTELDVVGVQASIADIEEKTYAARQKQADWQAVTPYERGQIIKKAADILNNSIVTQTEEQALQLKETAKVLFNFAALSTKYEGRIHRPTSPGHIVLAHKEPVGVVGISCPNEEPAIAPAVLIGSALAGGNTVVISAPETDPRVIFDIQHAFDKAGLPDGVLNIVTLDADTSAMHLASNDIVDAVWHHGTEFGSTCVETQSAESNLKQTWTNAGKAMDWNYLANEGAENMMRRATQVKNIWVPTA